MVVTGIYGSQHATIHSPFKLRIVHYKYFGYNIFLTWGFFSIKKKGTQNKSWIFKLNMSLS